MEFFEQMAITVVMGLLHQFIKNPAKQAQLRVALLELADSIYESYGIVPPQHT